MAMDKAKHTVGRHSYIRIDSHHAGRWQQYRFMLSHLCTATVNFCGDASGTALYTQIQLPVAIHIV